MIGVKSLFISFSTCLEHALKSSPITPSFKFRFFAGGENGLK